MEKKLTKLLLNENLKSTWSSFNLQGGRFIESTKKKNYKKNEFLLILKLNCLGG